MPGDACEQLAQVCSSWRIFTSKPPILLGIQQKGRSQKNKSGLF
jgi:hypothetical protein